MSSVLGRCLNIFVLFSYLNLVMTSAFAGSYQDADIRFEIEKDAKRGVNVKAFRKNQLLTPLVTDAKGPGYKIKPQDEGFKVRYKEQGAQGVRLSFQVAEDGHVTLRSKKAQTGVAQNRTWGIKTFGDITNQEDFSFHGLYTESRQLLNYGSVLLHDFSFRYKYLFNSGIIRIANSHQGFNIAAVKQAMTAYNYNVKPRYTEHYEDNYGYYFSDLGLNYPYATLRNYGYMELKSLTLLEDGSLDAYQPVIIHEMLDGNASYITNKSFMHIGEIAPTLKVWALRNEGVLSLKKEHEINKNLGLFSNYGLFLSANELSGGSRRVINKGIFSTDKALFDQLYSLPPAKALATLLNTSLRNDELKKRFYNHYQVHLLSQAVSVWIAQGLGTEEIRKRTASEATRRFIQKIAIYDLLLPKQAEEMIVSSLPENVLIKSMLRKAQADNLGLYAWLNLHPKAFLSSVYKLKSPVYQFYSKIAAVPPLLSDQAASQTHQTSSAASSKPKSSYSFVRSDQEEYLTKIKSVQNQSYQTYTLVQSTRDYSTLKLAPEAAPHVPPVTSWPKTLKTGLSLYTVYLQMVKEAYTPPILRCFLHTPYDQGRVFDVTTDHKEFIYGLGKFKVCTDGSFFLKGSKSRDTSKVRLQVNTPGHLALHNLKIAQLEADAKRVAFYKSFSADKAFLVAREPGLNYPFCRINADVDFNVRSLTQLGGQIYNTNSLPSLIKLNILQGLFVNNQVADLTDGLQLKGCGLFLNFKDLKAPTIQTSLLGLWNGGFINTRNFQNQSKVHVNPGKILAADYARSSSFIHDNSTGRLSSGGALDVEGTYVNNVEGSMSGINGTTVTVHHSFDGRDGVIGVDGSKANLALSQGTKVVRLGNLKGTQVEVDDSLNTASPNSLDHGALIASEFARVKAKNPRMPNVDVISPLIYLNRANSFLLKNQGNPCRTIVELPVGENFRLDDTFRTVSTLEFFQEGLSTEEQVIAEMKKRFGDGKGTLPAPQHKIEIMADVQADSGITVATPAAEFHAGSEALGKHVTFNLQNGFLKAYVSKLDLEKSTLAAIWAKSWAPHGNYIGRLIADPTRTLFSTFYAHFQQSSSSNLGTGVSHVRYDFLSQILTDVYDGRHLFSIPIAIPNGTSIQLKQQFESIGPLHHRAEMEVEDLILDSTADSNCIASVLRIRRNLELKDKGQLLIKRYIGKMLYHYHNHNEGKIWRDNAVLFAGSDPAHLHVGGRVISDHAVTISNMASNIHIYEKDPLISIKSEDFRAGRYQQFIGGTPQERKALSTDCIPHSDYQRIRRGHDPRWSSITWPRSWSFDYHDCIIWAVSFLLKTNNFAGAQNFFPANTSFATGVQLPADGTMMQGNVSMPEAIVMAGPKGLAIGTKNDFYLEPQDPVRSLLGKLNSHTIYVPKQVQEVLDELKKKPVSFMIKERFWFEDEEAQEFHETIADHVIVVTLKGLMKKPEGPALFSMTPNILLKNVQDQCQEALRRGYIYDNQKIDLEFLKQLHRNAHEYAQENNLSEAQIKEALRSALHGLPDPKKPIILYTGLVNQLGLEELVPTLLFPQKMLDDSRAARGGLIRTNLLAILPSYLTPDQMLALVLDNVVLSNALYNYFKQNPQLTKQLTAAAKDYQHQLKEKGEPLPAIPQGTVDIFGTLRTGQSFIAVPHSINHHADLEAETTNFMMSLLGAINIESKKERVYTAPENFFEYIPTPARLAAGEMLQILARGNIIFQGAQTNSGELNTHIYSMAKILDVPVMLMTQSVQRTYDEMHMTRTSTPHLSTHTSTADIQQRGEEGVDLHAPKYKANNADISSRGNVNLHEVHRTVETQSQTTRKGDGLFEKDKHFQSSSYSAQSQGAEFEVKGKVNVTSEEKDINATNISIQSETRTPSNLSAQNGQVRLNQGTTYRKSTESTSSSNAFWQSNHQKTEEHRTYSPCRFNAKLVIKSKNTIIQLVAGQPSEFLDLIQQKGGPLIQQILYEHHQIDEQSYSGPTAACAAVVALAVSIATAGWGASVASTLALKGTTAVMVQAGVQALCAQTAVAFLSNNFDPAQTVASLANKETVLGVIEAMAVAGVLDKLGLTSRPETLIGHAKVAAARAATQSAFRVVGHGDDVDQVLRDAVKNIVVDTLSGYMAQKIGEAYKPPNGKPPEIDPFMHKAAHAALGAVTGAVTSKDPARGAIAGAIGAAMAETVAEILSSNVQGIVEDVQKDIQQEGVQLTLDEVHKRIDQKLQRNKDLGRLNAGVVALMAGQDTEIAIKTGTNALENNFVIALVPYLTIEAIMAFLATPAGQALILATGLTLYQFGQYLKEQYKNLDLTGLEEGLKGIFAGLDRGEPISQNPGFTPEQSKPQVQSTPIPEDTGPTIHSTPVHEAKPQVNSTPVPEETGPSIFSTPIFEGPDASVLNKIRHDKIYKTYDSYEQARNAALKEFGVIDQGTRETLTGKMGVGLGRKIGFSTLVNGIIKEFRVDFDHENGPHIDIEIGKGSARRKTQFQFPGTQEDVRKILKRQDKDKR